MARAVLKYTFAAVLALLSVQAGVPFTHVVAGIEIVCCTEAEQQSPREAPSVRPQTPNQQPVLPYASRTPPEPDGAVLFQRPPPSPSLF